MKQKPIQINSQKGFTLIELLVVLSIMIVISTIVILDFANQRQQRAVTIAKNETVTNIRKVQSYMLSSKNISPGVPAKYYVVRIATGDTSYKIQAIDNSYTFHDPTDPGATSPLETVQLPSGIKFGTITVAPSDPMGSPTTFPCVQVIFSAPYGKMIARGAPLCRSTIKDTLQDPIATAALNEREVTIALTNTNDTLTGHSITLTPVSGLITPH